MNEAPELKDHLFKALLTVFRSKKLEADYTDRGEFYIRAINGFRLEKFRKAFNFSEEIPLPYFYLICQGIHTHQMAEKSFPLPLPGMVHIESEFHLHDNIDPNISIRIESNVSIEYKKEGSLLPVFEDHFFQAEKKVLSARNLYLVKRKKKQTKKTPPGEEVLEKKHDNWSSFIWKIPGNTGRKYAVLSGDFNPIHLFNFLAWLFGLKKKIIQGWYLASRAVAEVEKDTHMPAKSLMIRFEKPFYLPSDAHFEYRLSSERNLHFRLQNNEGNTQFISGNIG